MVSQIWKNNEYMFQTQIYNKIWNSVQGLKADKTDEGRNDEMQVNLKKLCRMQWPGGRNNERKVGNISIK